MCCCSERISFSNFSVLYFCVQEEGLTDVQEMIRLEKPNADRRLRGVLEELGTGCKYGVSFFNISKIDIVEYY